VSYKNGLTGRVYVPFTESHCSSKPCLGQPIRRGQGICRRGPAPIPARLCLRSKGCDAIDNSLDPRHLRNPSRLQGHCCASCRFCLVSSTGAVARRKTRNSGGLAPPYRRPAVSLLFWPQAHANGSNRSSDRRSVLEHDGALEHAAKNSESDAASSRRMPGPQSSRRG
jgi:hypothetical protein